MNILAIDPATKSGWAVYNGKKVSKSGVIDFKNGPWDGAGVRYLKFQTWVSGMIDKHSIDLVFYECVERHQGGTYAAHVYGGYIAALQSACESLKVPYTGEGVGTIKKFWTGSGNAGKEAMIKEARERGHNPKDDNEADAIAICYVAVEQFKALL